MLTSGDIEFEPGTSSKLASLSSSILVMQSGDLAFHTEVMREVMPIVQKRIEEQPENWWLVKDIADLYVNYRNRAKQKRAEAELLTPLGMTLDNFRREMRHLTDEIAEQLTRDLINYNVPHTSIIVTGIDNLGPHIYVIDDGNVSCNDTVGFAAVGIGARHAESQFMLAKHSWNSSVIDTGLLAFIAKKRSEIAPGVGEGTDMFTMGPGLGSLFILPNELIQRFETIYRTMRQSEDQIQNEARRQANEFIEAAAKAAEQARGQKEPAVQGTTALESKTAVRTKRSKERKKAR